MKIGIIGGSGLYNIEGFSVEEELFPETPFGTPSDKLSQATYREPNVLFSQDTVKIIPSLQVKFHI